MRHGGVVAAAPERHPAGDQRQVPSAAAPLIGDAAPEPPRESGVARLKQVVVDCRHPASLARFWAEVLDDFAIRPYDDAEIARLAGIGRTPESDPSVILDGPRLELCFQEVDSPLAMKRPLHLDMVSNDRPAEVERLSAIGAAVVQSFDAHTWMRDPEGNDFCITDW